MNFISESHIEQALEALEESDAQVSVEQFAKRQPALMHYLMTESFEALTHPEQNYLLYLALVIESAIQNQLDRPLPDLNLDVLAQCEDQNWETFTQHKAKSFRDRITPFFENYPQEDLLAFVEDALEDDPEEPVITPEGKPYIFISLKSLIDTYQASIS